jgi:hypothetical protein
MKEDEISRVKKEDLPFPRKMKVKISFSKGI